MPWSFTVMNNFRLFFGFSQFQPVNYFQFYTVLELKLDTSHGCKHWGNGAAVVDGSEHLWLSGAFVREMLRIFKHLGIENSTCWMDVLKMNSSAYFCLFVILSYPQCLSKFIKYVYCGSPPTKKWTVGRTNWTVSELPSLKQFDSASWIALLVLSLLLCSEWVWGERSIHINMYEGIAFDFWQYTKMQQTKIYHTTRSFQRM